VIAPASTGKDNKSNTAVIKTVQTKSGNCCMPIPLQRMFKIVTMKLIAPAIDDTPARCNEKMQISTAAPE
jgi:hypothetical protein